MSKYGGRKCFDKYWFEIWCFLGWGGIETESTEREKKFPIPFCLDFFDDVTQFKWLLDGIALVASFNMPKTARVSQIGDKKCVHSFILIDWHLVLTLHDWLKPSKLSVGAVWIVRHRQENTFTNHSQNGVSTERYSELSVIYIINRWANDVWIER